MKLFQWTLFIDMLGYRDINGEISSEDKAKKFVQFMSTNKKIFDHQNSDFYKMAYKENQEFDLYEYYDVKYAFVSDSFIITFYPKEVKKLKKRKVMYMHSANALFIITMRIQVLIYNCLKEHGLFLRGGISNKYCYIEDSFAVGEGLIEAYTLESKVAVTPRIVLHESITNNKNLMDSIKYLSNAICNGNQIVSKDDDDVFFLDYIKYNLSLIDLSSPKVKAQIISNKFFFDNNLKSIKLFLEIFGKRVEHMVVEYSEKIKKSKNSKEKEALERVLVKYEWLKKYFNSRVALNDLVKDLEIK